MFDENRIVEIKISNPDCWKRCPGSGNPCDTLSQRVNLTGLMAGALVVYATMTKKVRKPTLMLSGDWLRK